MNLAHPSRTTGVFDSQCAILGSVPSKCYRKEENQNSWITIGKYYESLKIHSKVKLHHLWNKKMLQNVPDCTSENQTQLIQHVTRWPTGRTHRLTVSRLTVCVINNHLILSQVRTNAYCPTSGYQAVTTLQSEGFRPWSHQAAIMLVRHFLWINNVCRLDDEDHSLLKAGNCWGNKTKRLIV